MDWPLVDLLYYQMHSRVAKPDDGNHIPLQATGAGELQADSPGGKCVGAAGRSGIGIVPDCRTGSAVAD